MAERNILINNITDQFNTRDRSTNLGYWFLLAGLCLYALSIPTISALAPSLFFPAIFLLKRRAVSLGFLLDLSLLVVFCITYYTISIVSNNIDARPDMFLAMVNIGIVYYVGYLFGQNSEEWNASLYFPILSVVLFGVLSTYAQLISAGGIIIIDREVASFWSTNTYINAPIIGLYLSLGICSITALFSKANIYIKIFVLIISITSLVADLAIQNRSPVYAGVLAISTGLLYFLFSAASNRKNKLFVPLLIFSVLIIGFILWGIVVNFSFVEDFVEEPLISRFVNEGFESGRYELWAVGLNRLIEYPFGGGAQTYIITSSYAHNFWIDIGLSAGFLPVLMIIIFQARHIGYVFRYIISKKRNEDYFIIGIVISYFIGLFIEPAMQASSIYITLFAFIMGAIKSIIKHGDF